MIRLGFHDAGPYEVVSNTGGPNGCIDFNDPDNAGLQNIVATLTAMQATLKNSDGVTITLADLYQYAALTAVWCALPSLPKGHTATKMGFTYLYGRSDAASCPYTNDVGRLPAAEGFYPELTDLKTRWGITMHDLTALMGAHTMGTVKQANSGYTFPSTSVGTSAGWVTTNGEFNGFTYYSHLLKFRWVRQANSANTKHSWNAGAATATPTIMVM